MNWDPLVEAAKLARQRAYAPYSRFRVGAALLGESGEIYTGCNVENRTFGLTVCAERTAVVSAIANGESAFQAIAVATNTSPPSAPCGMCLETLTEFAEDLPIMLVNSEDGERRLQMLRALHPNPFRWPSDLAREPLSSP